MPGVWSGKLNCRILPVFDRAQRVVSALLILRWILTRCLAPLPQSRLIGRTVSPPLPLVKSLPRLRPPPSARHIQHTLLHPLDELSFRSLLESQPIRSRARLQAASRRGASGWLHILPIKALGYRLAPRVVRAALRYRLGVRIFASADSSLCPLCKVKPALLDPWGDHAVICPCTGKRIAKHNRLRDVLFRFAVKGTLSPAKEVRLDSSRTVPGDIYFPMWSRNRGMAFDVMITSPLQSKFLVASASEDPFENLAALRAAEKLKDRKHFRACKDEGIDFAPLVFDTFGGWTPEVSHVISVISKCAAARSGERCGEVRSQVEQQLSLALTRCTAAMILAIEAC